MESRRFKAYLIVIALLGGALLWIATTGRVALDDRLPIAIDLPGQVGDYTGTGVLFCRSDQCLSEFPRNTLEQTTTCPQCGAALDALAPAERALLPADTDVGRKRYEDGNGNIVTASVVVSGGDRRSIHPPQACLVAQGRRITNQTTIEIPLQDRAPLTVMLLELSRSDAGPTAPQQRACYAYWFTDGNRETPYHTQRLAWTAWDGIARGRRTRWAYVTVAPVPASSATDPEQQLRRFITALYPLIER